MADETILRSHGLRTNVGKLIRVDTLEGREHLVAPVVLITEGVHNNVYYSADELAKHTDAWNGRPLVAPSHPTVNGRPVTANSKKVLEKMQVGTVLNVHWNAGTKKLLGEAWFDKEKTQAKCPKVLAELEKEAPQVEVSTGLYTDDTFKANTFGTKQYACEAKNHRPDHLAVLLNAKGACSWEDGAGLPRINSAADDDDLDELHANFDPNQPRDKDGKFSGGGSTTGKDGAAAQRERQRNGEVLTQLRDEATELRSSLIRGKMRFENEEAAIEVARRVAAAVSDLEDNEELAVALARDNANPHRQKEYAELRNDIVRLREDLADRLAEINEDWDLRINAKLETCPDCGGELVDGVCPECDGEEDPVAPKQNAIMRTLSAIAEKLGITVNKKGSGISLREKEQRVSKALTDRYRPQPLEGVWGGNQPVSCGGPSPWVRDLFDGYVVYELLGKTYKLDVSWNDGMPELGDEPVEVVQNTEWLPKNNSADQWIETDNTWEVPGWEAAK